MRRPYPRASARPARRTAGDRSVFYFVGGAAGSAAGVLAWRAAGWTGVGLSGLGISVLAGVLWACTLSADRSTQ